MQSYVHVFFVKMYEEFWSEIVKEGLIPYSIDLEYCIF